MEVRVAVEPGISGRVSEDATHVAPGLVVLLDGATVRTDSGCVHGVAWYAESLASRISRSSRHAEVSLKQALAIAIAETAALHADTCDLSHPGTPSAAVGIVQVVGDMLRYLVLGDVTVVFGGPGMVWVVTDQRISRSAVAERAMADAMSATDPRKGEVLVRMKHAELAARNSPGGYWIAAADPTAAEHALTGEVPLAEVEQVGVFSDGAARAVDMFDLYDWRGVLDVLRRSGPAELIRQVRAVEATDPEAVRWPRNKLSDDATAAYCTIEA